MNLSDILIILILAIVCFLIIYSFISKKKKGMSITCSYGCQKSCPGCKKCK